MKQRSTLTYIGVALAAIALIGFAITQLNNPQEPGAASQVPLAGDMTRLNILSTPRDVSQQNLIGPEGEEVRLSDLHGRPIIANFWATWCAPCRKEMPSLARLQKALEDEPVTVITIASGPTPDSAIYGFMEEIGVDNLPLYRDPSQAISRDMGVLALPVTVLINAEGKEVARFIGDADWDSEEAKAAIVALFSPN